MSSELYGEAMDIIKNASETIFNRLVWLTAKRDQAGIADKLANEQEVDEIYGLGDAGLFDEFFHFLRELGIMKILEQLVPRRHRKRQSPVPFSAIMLIYLMRIVAGLKFFYHTGPVLLVSFRQTCMKRATGGINLGYQKISRRIAHGEEKIKGEATSRNSTGSVFRLA